LHWDTSGGDRYEVILAIVAKDRQRLLADISSEISSTGTNIQSSGLRTTNNSAKLHFTVEVVDIHHLNRIVQRLIEIEGVQSVTRRKRGE
jgi:GTP pyrophosphokinase